MNAYTMKSKLDNVISNGAARRINSSSQGGFGIIEIGIVLVIVSMMLAVTLSYVRGTLASNRANDEAKELSSVVLNIQRLYANRSAFTSATTIGSLANNGVFPTSRTTGSGTTAAPTNRWQGLITAAVSASPYTTLTLTYAGVPSAECNTLIPQLEGVVTTITVGGSSVKGANSVVDVAALGTQCSTTLTTIAYTFGTS
jgi:type II secretory pathway pseudopilin PulG